MTLRHTDAIDWPNGEGYTPCTPEYAETMAKRDDIFDANHDDGSVEDLPSHLYEEWHQLNSKLDRMLLEGHLGKSVRY